LSSHSGDCDEADAIPGDPETRSLTICYQLIESTQLFESKDSKDKAKLDDAGSRSCAATFFTGIATRWWTPGSLITGRKRTPLISSQHWCPSNNTNNGEQMALDGCKLGFKP